MEPKLILFDIDGTLLSARGIPKIVMNKALSRRYARFSYDETYDFSGRTDPEIIEHLLNFSKISFTEADIETILQEFAVLLEVEFQNNHQPYLLKGVDKLIPILDETAGLYLGLVTGNISQGARIKLERAGIAHYFPVGGFGDDSKHRVALPPIAKSRAEAYYKTEFSKPNIWIIGDSIFDINCALENDLRSLAVATGRTEKKDLVSAGPEFIEDDLSNTDAIMEILLYR